jgi:hypothetical protein
MAGRSDKELFEDLEKRLSDSGERLSQYRTANEEKWPAIFVECGMTLSTREEVRLTTYVMDVLKEGPSLIHTQSSRSTTCLAPLSDALCSLSSV